MKDILGFFFRVFGQALFALVSFFVILFLFSLFFLGLGVGAGSSSGIGKLKETEVSDYSFVSGDKDSANKLLSVPVNGIILGSAPDEDFAFGLSEFLTYGYEVADLFADAAEDDEIKGVLVRFRTPGGTIFGSRAIFRAIEDYRSTTDKPVVAYVEGMSASGGVMAMVGANAIYADHGSIVGSIGVLGPTLTYFNKPMATEGGLFGGGIVTEEGIERTTITAGRGKDIGNPFRKPTAEEIANLKSGVDNEYAEFVKHVAQTRNMDASMIRDEMGAQIFDNKTAQAYGLIDATKDLEQSIASLAELAGIGDDYQLVKPSASGHGLMGQIFGAMLGEREIGRQEARQDVRRQVCDSVAPLTMAYYGDLASLCQ
jgi:protease-4